MVSVDKVKVADVVPAKYAEFLSYCESRGKTHVSDVTKVDIATFAAISGVASDYVEAVRAALHLDAAGNPAPGPAAKTASQTVSADAAASDRPLGQVFRVNPSDFESAQIQMLLLEPHTSAVLARAHYQTVGDVLARSAQQLLNSNGMNRELTQEVVQKAARFVDLRDYLRHVSGNRKEDVFTQPMGTIMRVGPKNNKSAGLHVLNMSPEAKAFLMKEGHCWSIGTLMGLSMSDLLKIPHESWDLAEEIVHVSRKHIAEEKGEGMPYVEPVGRAQQAVRRVLTGLKDRQESAQASASGSNPVMRKPTFPRVEKDAESDTSAANSAAAQGTAQASTSRPGTTEAAEKTEPAASPQGPAAKTAPASESAPTAADLAASAPRKEEQPVVANPEPAAEEAGDVAASSLEAQPVKNVPTPQTESAESGVVAQKTDEESEMPALSGQQTKMAESAIPETTGPKAAVDVTPEAVPESTSEKTESAQESVESTPASETEETADTEAVSGEPGAESAAASVKPEENAPAADMEAATAGIPEAPASEDRAKEAVSAELQDMSAVAEVADTRPAEAGATSADMTADGSEPEEMAGSNAPEETMAGSVADVPATAEPAAAEASPEKEGPTAGVETATDATPVEIATSVKEEPAGAQWAQPTEAAEAATSAGAQEEPAAAEPEEATTTEMQEEHPAAESANAPEGPDASGAQLQEEPATTESASAMPTHALMATMGAIGPMVVDAEEAVAGSEGADLAVVAPEMTASATIEEPANTESVQTMTSGAIPESADTPSKEAAHIAPEVSAGTSSEEVAPNAVPAAAEAQESAGTKVTEAATAKPVVAPEAAELSAQGQEPPASTGAEEPDVQATTGSAGATALGTEHEGAKTQTEEASSESPEVAAEAEVEGAPGIAGAETLTSTRATEPAAEPEEIVAVEAEEAPSTEPVEIAASAQATEPVVVNPEEIAAVEVEEEAPSTESVKVAASAEASAPDTANLEEIAAVEAEEAPSEEPVEGVANAEAVKPVVANPEEIAAIEVEEEAPSTESGKVTASAEAAAPDTVNPEEIAAVEVEEEAPSTESVKVAASAEASAPDTANLEEIAAVEAEEAPSGEPVEGVANAEAVKPVVANPEEIAAIEVEEEAPSTESGKVTASAEAAAPDTVNPEEIAAVEAEEAPSAELVEGVANAEAGDSVVMNPEEIVASVELKEAPSAEPVEVTASAEAADPTMVTPEEIAASTEVEEEVPSAKLEEIAGSAEMASAEEESASKVPHDIAVPQTPAPSAPKRIGASLEKNVVSPLLLSFLQSNLNSDMASKLVQMAPALHMLQQSPKKAHERISFLDMPVTAADMPVTAAEEDETATAEWAAAAEKQAEADAAAEEDETATVEWAVAAEKQAEADAADDEWIAAEERQAEAHGEAINAWVAAEERQAEAHDEAIGAWVAATEREAEDDASNLPEKNATDEEDVLAAGAPVVIEEPAAEEGDICETVPVEGEGEIPDDSLAVVETVPEAVAELEAQEGGPNEEARLESAEGETFIPAEVDDSAQAALESEMPVEGAEDLPYETLLTPPTPVEEEMEGEPHPGIEDTEYLVPEVAPLQAEPVGSSDESSVVAQTEEIPATVRIAQKHEGEVTLGDLARLIEDAHTSMSAGMSEIERIAQKTPEEITLSELAKLIRSAREAKASRTSLAVAEPETEQIEQTISEDAAIVDMPLKRAPEAAQSDLDAINEAAEEDFNAQAIEDMRALEEMPTEPTQEPAESPEDMAPIETTDVSDVGESAARVSWDAVQEALEAALAESQDVDLADLEQLPPAGAMIPDVPLSEDDWEAIEAALDGETDAPSAAHELEAEEEMLLDESGAHLADEPDADLACVSEEERPAGAPESEDAQVTLRELLVAQDAVASMLAHDVLASLEQTPEDTTTSKDMSPVASSVADESLAFAAEETQTKSVDELDSLERIAESAPVEQTDAEAQPGPGSSTSDMLGPDERTEALLALDEELAELEATLDEPTPDMDSVNERLDAITEEMNLLGISTEDVTGEMPKAEEPEGFPAPSSVESIGNAVQGYVTLYDAEESEQDAVFAAEEQVPQSEDGVQQDVSDETDTQFVFPITPVSAPEFDEVIARKAPLADISGVLADVLNDNESLEEDAGQEEDSFADVLGADPAQYDDVPLAQLGLTPQTAEEISDAGCESVGDVLREYVEDLISYKGVSPLAAVEVTTALARFLSVSKSAWPESAEPVSPLAQQASKTGVSDRIMSTDELAEDDIDMPLREAFGVASAQFGRAGISFLNLSVRPRTCLRQAGCATISDVLDMSVDDLLNTRGMTATAVEEVLQKLETMVSKSVADDVREAQEQPDSGRPQMDEFEQPMAHLLGVDPAAFDWMDLNLLKVNSRTKRVLRQEGVASVGDLLRKSRADLLQPDQMDLSSVGHLFHQLKHLAAIHEFVAQQTPSGTAEAGDYARALGHMLGMNPDTFEGVPLDTLRVAPYTEQCLREGARCDTVADLLYLSVQDLLETPRMDSKAVGQILRGLWGTR